MLSGTVGQPQSAQQADAVVQAAGFKTVNMLQSPVTDMTQIQLSVRVAEVSRQKLRELGSSIASANSTSFFVQGGGPGTLGSQGGGGNPGNILTDLPALQSISFSSIPT